MLHELDLRGHTAFFGYYLAEEWWGRGVMGAVVPAFTDYAFEKFPNLLRLEANVLHENEASARVLQRSGYKLECRQRQCYLKHGKLFDGLLHVMLRDEWEARRRQGGKAAPA
jgi:RimJ/RimL family protein N-acetyltransferase